MKNWALDLSLLLDRTWTEIGARAAPRTGFAGLAFLATRSPAGPAQRAVVIRQADRPSARVWIHTDSATPKLAEIAADPAVGLLIWQPRERLQIRLDGQARAITGAAAAALWQDIPAAARGNFGVDPAPGTAIAGPLDYARRADPARLAVIEIALTAMDVVHLGRPRHVRARYAAAEAWAGTWCAP